MAQGDGVNFDPQNVGRPKFLEPDGSYQSCHIGIVTTLTRTTFPESLVKKVHRAKVIQPLPKLTPFHYIKKLFLDNHE